jgi:hypothetical protein
VDIFFIVLFYAGCAFVGLIISLVILFSKYFMIALTLLWRISRLEREIGEKIPTLSSSKDQEEYFARFEEIKFNYFSKDEMERAIEEYGALLKSIEFTKDTQALERCKEIWKTLAGEMFPQ